MIQYAAVSRFEFIISEYWMPRLRGGMTTDVLAPINSGRYTPCLPAP